MALLAHDIIRTEGQTLCWVATASYSHCFYFLLFNKAILQPTTLGSTGRYRPSRYPQHFAIKASAFLFTIKVAIEAVLSAAVPSGRCLFAFKASTSTIRVFLPLGLLVMLHPLVPIPIFIADFGVHSLSHIIIHDFRKG